jgi:hypothetical protein
MLHLLGIQFENGCEVDQMLTLTVCSLWINGKKKLAPSVGSSNSE